MNNVDFIPNTSEWKEMRKDKIGASDAPIIMEVSPYSTPYELWQRKVGLKEDQANNFAMQRGIRLEPVARSHVESSLGIPLFPVVKFHKDHTWMLATLDGLSEDEKTLVEIKCAGSKDHHLALEGKIPEKYYPQLQHQLEVCELEKGCYYSFDGKEGILVEFYRNDKYIKKLINKEKEFYICLQDLSPPSLIEGDYKVMNTPTWKSTVSNWKQIQSQLNDLEEEEKCLRNEIISLCANKNCIGEGVIIKKIHTQGSIDYSKIPELKNIDIEKYRKNPSSYWKIIQI